MVNGKNINMFLMEGDVTGIIKCTLLNWTGVIYKIPRLKLNSELIKKRQHFKNSGIFNIINILNNEKIEEIIDLNYKVSKGEIKDEEMKKIEKQIGYNIEKELTDNDEIKF